MHEGPGGGGLGKGNERASLFYLSSADQEIKAARRWGARRLAATPNTCVQLPSLHEAKTCSLNDFS